MKYRECQVSACLFAVLLSAALLLSACGQSTETFLARGEEYLQKRKFHDALMQFRSAEESDPGSAKAHWGLARSYEQLGQFNEALEEFRETVDLDVTNLDAKAKLGNYFLLLTPPMTGEAEAIQSEIFAADPQFIEGHILKASIMAAKGASDAEITQVVDKAIALDPQRIESYISLQRFNVTRGNPAGGERAIKAGIAANPSSILGHIEYGRFLMYSSRDVEAEDELKKAILINGSDIQAREAIAEFYFTSRRFDKAEEAQLKLVEIQENSPESRLDLAVFYQKIGRTPDAIGVLEQILSNMPEYARARYKLGEIHLDRKDFPKVNEQLEALLAVDANDAEALMLRARLHIQQNAADKAIEDLEIVLKKRPSGREPLYLMARARMAAGQVDQANAFIADLERYHPGDLRAGLLRIQAAFTTGDPRNLIILANGLLDKLATEIPDAVNSFETMQDLRLKVLSSRGLANLDLNKLKEARIDLESVVNISPNSSFAVVNLAKVDAAEHKFEKARDLFTKASTLEPTNFDAISGIVDANLRLGRPDLAREKIDGVMTAGSSDPAFLAGLHYLKSTTYQAEKDLASAEKELLEAMASDAHYLPAYSGYAAMLVKQNRTDEAVVQYQAVVELKSSAQVYTLLGMLEESRGRFNEAETCYRKALLISPDQPIAANNLAWLLAEREGNLDEALQLASAAVAKGPDNAGFNDTLGFVYLQKGLNLPAIEKFRRAVTLDVANSKKTGTPVNPGYKQRLETALGKTGNRTFTVGEPRA
jgi:tetratricopeptide (TPR) repeat protein